MPAKFLIGLTGSIGMGKSQTAALFAELGVPVFDADAAIYQLYAKGGAAVGAIAAAFPGATRDGAVDRGGLSDYLAEDPGALARLEAIVHPLVGIERNRFLARQDGIALLDVPLLFETGGHKNVDAVVVASASPQIQHARVMARPGMTEEKFGALHARQWSDAQKRAQADYVVETGQGLDHARGQVKMILSAIREKIG